MTRAEAVAIIQRGLGFRSDLETEIVASLQECQRLLEAGPVLPWFLIEEDYSLSGTASDPDVTLPTDFLVEDDNSPPRFVLSSGGVVFLKKAAFEAVTKTYQGLTAEDDATATGTTAYAYALRLSTMRVFPTPTSDYEILIDYYKKQAVLNSGGATNDWLNEDYLPELLVGMAGKKMADILRDQEASQIFAEKYNLANQAVLAKTTNRELAARRVVMGSRL